MATRTINLRLSWAAYTSEYFDRIYDAHAERIGHRPGFTILHGGDHARVLTTDADADAARAIIAELEHIIQPTTGETK